MRFRTLRSRWRTLAQRAADVQANVLFFLLYYVAIVPMALLRLGGRAALKRPATPPAWTDHDRSAADLTSAHRQF
jgi:hypothetical protein